MAETHYDEKVRKHYDEVARAAGTSPISTMADEIVRETETSAILSVVAAAGAANLAVTDVGCGNGYTLRRLAEMHPRNKYTGIEYNDSLRALASQQVEGKGIRVLAGDLRRPETIEVKPETVDVLICQRVLINLMELADQKAALGNIVRLVRPGGLLLFIEAFESGRVNLNEARAEFGLSPIAPAIHNLYLPDDFFQHPSIMKSRLAGVSFEENGLSTHYYVSRVLHDVVTKVANSTSQRNSHFVKFFSRALPAGVGNYSPLRMMLFSKVR